MPNSADKITAKQIPKFIPENGKQNVYSKREIQRSRNGNKTQISKYRENCSKTETQCKWCGNSKIHSKEQCPAKNAIVTPVKRKVIIPGDCGKIQKPYKIKLKENAKPYAIMVPRRVPIPLKDALQKKLDKMITQEIIEPVDEASE
ncbi:hypothetical protein AVEN_255308-1 [Araneus ventricosus]|uniref:Reverse transcriptase domain-containing protein n=1 Tax=Araneus ventricosus TaxID=182803 RepID=A0A4Y2BDK1_ARAVE|nr:hypothetical protein AVEN_255308-1 [Araneus ventricosus]